MAIHVQIDPLERTATLRGVHSLCAGESSEVILSGVPDADTPTLSLRVYRDSSEAVQVACSVRPGTDPAEEGLVPVEGRAALRRGTLDLRTSAVSEWASEDAEAAEAAEEARRSGSKEPEARAAASYRRPDSAWLVVADSSRVWAACSVPFVLRPFDDALSPDPEVPLPSYAERAEAAAAAAAASASAASASAAEAAEAVVSGAVARAELFDGPDSASPKVKASLLPSYVDDVLEVAALPSSGESGKLYVVTGTNAVYRWSGSSFVEVSPSRDWSGELARKQDVIPDLEAIRSKANSALQAHQDISGKRDLTDLSVDRGKWLLVKPDGTQARLEKSDPQRDAWTGDGFTLSFGEEEGGDPFWFLWKTDSSGWVVDDSVSSPPDANRLEFMGSDGTSVYRLVRGSRLVLDTEIPVVDDAVTRTSENPVKGSGIWSAIWGALASLPFGFASLYDWCVAQLAGKRGLDDLSYRRQDPSEGGWILHMDGNDVRLLPAGELTWTDTGSETEWTYNLKWIGQWHLAYVAGSGLATCVDQESPEDATELTLVSTSDYETVVATATAAPVDDTLALMSEVSKKQDALTQGQIAAANSGATAAKVAAWDGYAAQIAAKASASDLRYRIADAGFKYQFAASAFPITYMNTITSTPVTITAGDAGDITWDVQSDGSAYVSYNGFDFAYFSSAGDYGDSQPGVDLQFNGVAAANAGKPLVQTVADRAENLITATDETSIDIELPSAVTVDGVRYCRDFLLDVDNSANASDLALEFTALGVSYAFAPLEDDSISEMMTIGAGERVRLYFTETPYTATGSLPVINVARVTLGDFVTTTQGGN